MKKKNFIRLTATLLTITLLSGYSVYADPPAPPSGGGVPGGMEEDTSSIIINQVYGIGDSDSNIAAASEYFIELFNNSGETVDLSTFKLTYFSTEDGNTYELALTGELNGYTSYLIKGASVNKNSVISIDQYNIEWNQAIDDDSYQIVLYDDSTVVDSLTVDNSGNGDYSDVEGNAVSGINAKSTVRRNNYTDTDDNSSDFAVIDYTTATTEELSGYLPLSVSDGVVTLLKDLSISIGATEDEVGISWFSTSSEDGTFEIVKESDADSEDFSSDKVNVYTVKSAASYESGCYYFQLTVENLESETNYIYRYGNNGKWSETGSYTTKDLDEESYSFIAIGDAQIGASGDSVSDGEGWEETLNNALTNFSDTEFILSVGDQINRSNSTTTLSKEYSLFFKPEILSSVPFVATVGNHDASTTLFNEHFNLPNVSDYGSMGEDASEGDYYFAYKNTLYMVLNTNNTDVEAHQAFLEEIAASNSEYTWKVVVFHQSIYSVARHVNDSDIETLRKGLSPLLYDLDIDVVLMGHDHVYARSYIMGASENEYGAEADKSYGSEYALNPDGVLYLTLNSSSGSKYYDITEELYEYTAFMSQESSASYSNVAVTDTSFTVTTYNSEDNSIIDTYTIYKDTDAPVITQSDDIGNNVLVNSEFNLLEGITAVDNLDGDLTESITLIGTVDTTTIGSYVLTYSVTDNAGNTSEFERTVKVVEKITEPEDIDISDTGDSTESLWYIMVALAAIYVIMTSVQLRKKEN